MTGLYDSYNRCIDYLRISVTDRCNLRCIYCTAYSIANLTHDDILRYEEIERVVRVAASAGIKKIRLTGGEPLLRLDLDKLVALIERIDGIEDISLTTNGILLGQCALRLKEAGLDRVNISLDTLQKGRFQVISGRDHLDEVLTGIEAAHRAGLEPVKINMVVIRGMNDDEVLDFARKSKDEGWHVRFIEYMPFATPGLETLGAVSKQEIWERIQPLGKLEPCYDQTGNGPAVYYRLPGAEGTIGFVTPVTEHFCQSCNRLRLTSDGQLRPCLLDDAEIDLKGPLRNGADNKELTGLIMKAVSMKPEQHKLARGLTPNGRTMCQIGG